MPYTIELSVSGGNHSPPLDLYRALYANLLEWIGAANPDLVEGLQGRPARKPFTISALNQDRDGEWRWRVTLLQDELWDALWSGAQAVGMLNLDGRTWPIRWPDVRVTRQSYDFLLTNVRPADSIKLMFLSPTILRKGEMDFPLPDPNAAFRSWLSHWNYFAPAQRCIDAELLEIVQARVAISAHRVHTQMHDLDCTQAIGFVGQVTYKILNARKLNQALVWQLNALADYAEFCGTGRKTTHGMGQTRRIRRHQ